MCTLIDDPARLLSEAQRTARRLPEQPADLDDLVQETVLRVWQRMQERGETGVPGALIRTTLRRLRIDRWRRKRPGPGGETAAVTDRSPLNDAALAELRATLRRAVARLPETQREVVRLRVYEGLKFKEIATMQQVPLNTVLGRMHLATGKLRDALEGHVREGIDSA
jgi:RNA polymerase sigma-70 factor (ECF subfamily)